MTAPELFDAMAPLVAPALEEAFERKDLCILATRVAIEVAQYFGVQATPLAVKVMVYNDLFARHLAAQDVDLNRPCSTWGDDSWAVGIGCGKSDEFNRWNGHLIAVADGCFGDFSIQQAERLEHGIHTGPALVGPYSGQEMWRAVNPETGTVIDYRRIADESWRRARNWQHEARRRPIVGKLIRALREREAAA